MNYAFLALLLFLASCQQVPPPEQKLYLQSVGEVSSSFELRIIDSIKSINARSGRTVVSLTPNGGRPLVMLNMRSTDTLAHTQYLDYRCLIEIDETSTITNSSPTDLEYVILHELGHCYGLDHSSDPTSVMYPTYVGTPFMTMGQVADVITRMTSFAKRIAY